MVDVAPADLDVPDRPPAAAHPVGGDAGAGQSACEAGQEVEQDRLRARGRGVPLDGDCHSVLRGQLGGGDRLLGCLEDGLGLCDRGILGGFAGTPACELRQLSDRDGACRRGRQRREAQRDPVGVVRRPPTQSHAFSLSEAYDVIRFDAASGAAKVQDALRLATTTCGSISS